MDGLVECVPNFSEGRNRAVIEAIVAAARGVGGCHILDVHSDPDHHRSVLTLAGEGEAVLEASLRVAAEAVHRIDLRCHQGVHPRIGAMDVVPFVPLGATPMCVCVRLAERFGQAAGSGLGIPCFLYGAASRQESHRELAWARRGGPESLALRILRHSDWAPDFGPAALHESAGAISVGAREPLIAFNILLDPPAGLPEAREIARRIRASNGGLPGVKALGFLLPSRNRAQVSMNLVDYRQSAPATVIAAVRAVASELGVVVHSGELVGLIPEAAVPADPQRDLLLDDFRPKRILEVRWRQASGREIA